MLIEFLGVPGVGKTTLARGIAADLRQHGYDAALLAMDAPAHLNRYVKLARQIGAIGRHAVARPRQVLRAARVLQYFPQPRVITHTKVMRYWLLTCAIIDRSVRQADVVVCDQGVCQGLYSLALLSPAPDQAAFCAALRLVPMPDLAILVIADRETVESRLACRRYSHRWVDKLLLNDPGVMEKSMRIVDQITAALHATDCPVIVHEVSASVTADTQELAAAVRGHLQGTAGGGGAPARANGSRLV